MLKLSSNIGTPILRVCKQFHAEAQPLVVNKRSVHVTLLRSHNATVTDADLLQPARADDAAVARDYELSDFSRAVIQACRHEQNQEATRVDGAHAGAAQRDDLQTLEPPVGEPQPAGKQDNGTPASTASASFANISNAVKTLRSIRASLHGCTWSLTMRCSGSGVPRRRPVKDEGLILLALFWPPKASEAINLSKVVLAPCTECARATRMLSSVLTVKAVTSDVPLVRSPEEIYILRSGVTEVYRLGLDVAGWTLICMYREIIEALDGIEVPAAAPANDTTAAPLAAE